MFQYLSQVKPKEFPSFVMNILTKIEGHHPIDITDGPGDEKQDILTITDNVIGVLSDIQSILLL